MAVVAAENPLPGEAGLIHEKHHCRKVRLLCTLGAQNNAKLVSIKVTVGAYSLHRLPIERLELLFVCKVPDKTMIQTDWMINCAGACGGVVLKCPHQIVTCELIILALCCACSLQMYQLPADNSQQK